MFRINCSLARIYESFYKVQSEVGEKPAFDFAMF